MESDNNTDIFSTTTTPSEPTSKPTVTHVESSTPHQNKTKFEFNGVSIVLCIVVVILISVIVYLIVKKPKINNELLTKTQEMYKEAAKKNKELIASQPKQLTKEELKEKGYDVTEPTHGKKRNKLWQIVTLNGQLLPTFTYKKDERKRVLDCNNCPPRDFFGATETAQFNYYSGKGFITKQKRTELIKWAFAFIKIGLKMLFRYYKVRKEYQKKAPVLTSLEYWEKKWSVSNEKN